MAAQVEMESGMVGSRLRLSPLTDSSNKTLMEDHAIIASEPKKPVLGPKPRLTPKPFSIERNMTVRPILAPKPQPKPKPEPLSKPEPPSKPKSTSAALEPGGKPTASKPAALSVRPEPSAANEPSKPESTAVVRRTSLGSSTGPASSRNTNITRAKSMGLLNRTGIEEEGRKDGDVVLRPRDGGASRPRPVSAFIPSETTPQPAARWMDRRPLSSDLTSKFESSQRNPPTGESKENTPEEEEEEAGSVLKELDRQDAKPLEKAGSGIKRRISLLIDSSSSSQSLPASRGAEPRSPVPQITDTDGAVGVKQRIKELTEDMSTAPNPCIKLLAKPRPLPVDLTKRFASEVESPSSAEPKGLQEGVEDLSWKSRDPPPTGQSKTPEDRKWQDVQDSTQIVSPMDVQTVRASLFENVVEKHSIQMLDTGSSGGPGKTVPRRSVSLRLKADLRPVSPEDEDDGSLVLATYQKVASPTDPRRVDHVFDTVAAVEESRAVSESVPAAHLEEKALTLRSRRSEVGERPQQTNLTSGATSKELSSSIGESRNQLKDKDGPSGKSGTEKSSPRFLRVGALPKWEESYVDRERELEREKQREMVIKMEEELQRQMEVQLAAQAELEEEEEFEAELKKQTEKFSERVELQVARPRATYFALTGQMNETVYQSAALNAERKPEDKPKSDLQFDDFSVKAGLRGVPNRATSVRRNLPQEAVYGYTPLEVPPKTEHPDRVRDYSRTNEEQRLKERQMVEYEKMMELQKQRELTKQRDLERERQIEAEKERRRVMEEQLEKERQRLAEIERKKELEKQRESQKKKELERERQKELERQREMERQLELERQRELERLEYERRKAVERELEQQREAERQRQKELEREKERMLDQERLRLREFEKQRERERQLELDRQKETERQKQMAIERQQELERLKELERQRETARQRELERQKQKELEHQRELERERQKAEERERQKAQEELKRIQEIERRQLLEYQLQKENERSKAAEDLQRSVEKGRRIAESPLRPKVLDLDSVCLGDRVAPGGDLSSTPKFRQPSNRDEEPYRPSILDVDSFRNQAQPGAVLDPFAMAAFSGPDFGGANAFTPPRESRSVSSLHPQVVSQNLLDHQRDPSPQIRSAEPAPLPAPLQPQVLHQPQPQAPPSDRQATVMDWAWGGRQSGSAWATSQFALWDVSHEETAVDEPLWVVSAKDSRRSVSTRHPSLERLLLNQEERVAGGMSPTSAPTSGLVSSPGGMLTPERVWSVPTEEGPAGNLPAASSRKESQTVATPSGPEPSWSPLQEFDPWNKGSSDSSRIRSRSVSQRFAAAESSVDGPLARLRSRSAHRDRGQDSREQLRPSVSGQDGNKDTDTLVQETDSQYGTWDTGLRTDESLTPATPSSESTFTPSPWKPSSPQTPEQPSTTPSSEDQPDSLSFIQSPTTLLDSSAQRSRVQLSKSCRRRRAPPSRAARHSAVLSEGVDFSSEEWRFKDSTEDKPDSGKQQDEESDEEEPVRESRPSTASSQPQRVSLFPGMDASALMAQLKKRNEAEGQSDAVSPSQLSRSPKSPFLPRASRVLPPPGGKENGEESPAWLKELKTKKRFSQIENDS